MDLGIIYRGALQDSDRLVFLFEKLYTRNTRAVRSDWEENFFDSGLTNWPRSGGLWRSGNSAQDILIVGTATSGMTHKDFTSDALSILLKMALVMSMAAIDKILHEAISQNFAAAVKSGRLNKIVALELSKSYEIAMTARERKGKGGSKRIRPAAHIKKAILDKLYRQTFLSRDSLSAVCNALGSEKIFEKYAHSFTPHRTAKAVGEEWSRLYRRRNQIAHECDIVQKNKMKAIHRHKFSSTELLNDITAIKSFGTFLASELE